MMEWSNTEVGDVRLQQAIAPRVFIIDRMLVHRLVPVLRVNRFTCHVRFYTIDKVIVIAMHIGIDGLLQDRNTSLMLPTYYSCHDLDGYGDKYKLCEYGNYCLLFLIFLIFQEEPFSIFIHQHLYDGYIWINDAPVRSLFCAHFLNYKIGI